MERQLTEGRPFGVLLRYALPVLGGNLFQLFYTLADTVIVGKTLAAVGSTGIISYFVLCFVQGLTGGFGICLGQCCGAGDETGMRRSAAVSWTLSAVFTLLLTPLVCLLARPVLGWMQTPEDIFADAYAYLFVILLGTGATVFYNIISYMLRALGDSRTPLVFLVLSSLLNIGLDILFIVPFHMGVAGAAWATVAGYCVGGIIPLVFFITHRSGLHLTGTKLYIREFLQACGNGASELMSNISSSLVGILYNLELMRLVGERGVAAHSVMMYVDFVFIAAFLGFSIGSAPIISYHFGAENHDELKNVFRRSMFLILVTSGAMVVLSEALCRPLCAAFVGYSPDLMQLTVHGFRLFALCYLFCGVNIYASAFFTALCNGALSAFISFLRSLLLRGGLVLLLPPVLGLDGVWLAVVAAEGLSAAVSAVLLRRQRTRYHYL